MRRPTKILTLATVFMFTAALLAWKQSIDVLYRYKTTPLEKTVKLENGFTASHSIHVDQAAVYWIAIQYEDTSRSPYDPIKQVLSKELIANYTLMAGTQAIGPSTSTKQIHPVGRNGITKYSLGNFDGVPGTPYDLSIWINSNVPILATANPKLSVSVDMLTYKDTVINAQMIASLAILLITIGLITLISIPINYLLWIRKTRKSGVLSE